MNTTNPAGLQQYINYQVATDQAFTNLIVNTETDSTTWQSPEGLFRPGTTYYWRASVRDGWDGHLGQTTRSWTPVTSFGTNNVPMPPQASASPGTAVGIAENPGATATAQTVTTLQPPLSVQQVADNDQYGGDVQYRFRIATGLDGRTGAIGSSPWQPMGTVGQNVTWRVPPGVLQDGGVYSWTVDVRDGRDESRYNTWVSRFRVGLRLGTSGPSPFDTAGPVTVNLANGNAALSFSSPTVQTVGGAMGYSFSYN